MVSRREESLMIDVGRFGIWQRASDVSPETARVIETLGFEALWVGGSPTEQLEPVQAALDATESVVCEFADRHDPTRWCGSTHVIEPSPAVAVSLHATTQLWCVAKG